MESQPYFHTGLLKSDYGRKYYPVPVPYPIAFVGYEGPDPESEFYTRWGLEVIHWAKKHNYDVFPLIASVQPVLKDRQMYNKFYDKRSINRQIYNSYNNSILYFQRHMYARDFMAYIRENRNIFTKDPSTVKIYGESSTTLTNELKTTGQVSSTCKIDYALPSTYNFVFELFDGEFDITDHRGMEMFLWLRENLQGKIWHNNKSIYFELEKDLSWFVLRWVGAQNDSRAS